MTDHTMTVQEILDYISPEIIRQEFCAYFQPQFNHSTGRLIGAEALARWNHPQYGLQKPSNFIPVLEQSDLITKLDLHIAECTCQTLKYCMEHDLPLAPISFNVSRQDIADLNFIEKLEQIRTKYKIPVRLLRIEITESCAISSDQTIKEIVDKFHDYGYIVEMDDFGSGYSCLNILKDIDFDVIKLDIKFLQGKIGGRGGIIINSIVHMANWLESPIISEGVETLEQGNYMKSIGCEYIQGYLYSKPLPQEEYLRCLEENQTAPMQKPMSIMDNINAINFWDPNSIETLLFSHFAGNSAIFSYEDGKYELLRVNNKFLKEIGLNESERKMLKETSREMFDPQNAKIFRELVQKAIASKEEEEAEVWVNTRSSCCGSDRICIRMEVQIIGIAKKQNLFHLSIRNITKEKNLELEEKASHQTIMKALDQVNMYAWEYIFATKEMHPCSRCQRDLGLPKVVRNYPEPVFTSGLFPMEYKEIYIEMLEKLSQGKEVPDIIIPLTKNRIPFKIRYTIEYDEIGIPYKAYGSAIIAK